MARAKSILLLFLLFVFNTTVKSSSSSSHSPSVPTLRSNSNKTIVINRFIWNSCKATLYHRLCYASLASYAVFIQKDPVLLSAFSANVTLTRILLTSAHVSAVRRSLFDFSASVVKPRTASALEDCVETLGEAVELTRKSAAELKALRTAKGADIAWHVGNAQTWMSAALTNEDTCADGFKKPDCAVGDGRVDADVVALIRKAGFKKPDCAVGDGSVEADVVARVRKAGFKKPDCAFGDGSVEADVVGWVRKAQKYSSNSLALVNSLVHR